MEPCLNEMKMKTQIIKWICPENCFSEDSLRDKWATVLLWFEQGSWGIKIY